MKHEENLEEEKSATILDPTKAKPKLDLDSRIEAFYNKEEFLIKYAYQKGADSELSALEAFKENIKKGKQIRESYYELWAEKTEQNSKSDRKVKTEPQGVSNENIARSNERNRTDNLLASKSRRILRIPHDLTTKLKNYYTEISKQRKPLKAYLQAFFFGFIPMFYPFEKLEKKGLDGLKTIRDKVRDTEIPTLFSHYITMYNPKEKRTLCEAKESNDPESPKKLRKPEKMIQELREICEDDKLPSEKEVKKLLELSSSEKTKKNHKLLCEENIVFNWINEELSNSPP